MTPPEPSPTAAPGPPPLPAQFTTGSDAAAPVSADVAQPGADLVNNSNNPRYTQATELLEALIAGKGGKTSSQKALLLMVSLAAFVLWLSSRTTAAATAKTPAATRGSMAP